MRLEAYGKKRDFSKTSEPPPELDDSFCKQVEKKLAGRLKNRAQPLYMVHDHHARQHHHDLRLEMDGALRSWAIPKLIDPANAEQRRLAVQTEDHPIAYGYWEGVIPKGNYGAGKSMIWDTGTFEILDHKPNEKLVFHITGRKLQGDFVLLHFRPQEKNWLFFKKKEAKETP